jgi:hypothetical protein
VSVTVADGDVTVAVQRSADGAAWRQSFPPACALRLVAGPAPAV